MKNFSCLFLLIFHAYSVIVTVKILPEELIEKCQENVENDAEYFGVDEVEIVFESDTDIFINGSVKILKKLESPWKSEYYAEQFYRDEWVRSPIQRKFDDLCKDFHNPTEMWYRLLKDIPGCPFSAGVNNLRLKESTENNVTFITG